MAARLAFGKARKYHFRIVVGLLFVMSLNGITRADPPLRVVIPGPGSSFRFSVYRGVERVSYPAEVSMAMQQAQVPGLRELPGENAYLFYAMEGLSPRDSLRAFFGVTLTRIFQSRWKTLITIPQVSGLTPEEIAEIFFEQLSTLRHLLETTTAPPDRRLFEIGLQCFDHDLWKAFQAALGQFTFAGNSGDAPAFASIVRVNFRSRPEQSLRLVVERIHDLAQGESDLSASLKMLARLPSTSDLLEKLLSLHSLVHDRRNAIRTDPIAQLWRILTPCKALQ